MSELSRERWARHADERALHAAAKYRLSTHKQNRLSALLKKGNAGTLAYEPSPRMVIMRLRWRLLELHPPKV